jgi:chemotaxis receptor (MCP) glutamine deamidase CheD
MEWDGMGWAFPSTYLVVGSCVHVVLHDRRSSVVFALALDLHKCGDDVPGSHKRYGRRATDNAALTLREVRSREASVTSGVSGGAALVLNLQQHAQIADAAASSAAVQGRWPNITAAHRLA